MTRRAEIRPVLPKDWGKKNQRRAELIRKAVYEGTLADEDARELKALQAEARRVMRGIDDFDWERLNADRIFLGLPPYDPRGKE